VRSARRPRRCALHEHFKPRRTWGLQQLGEASTGQIFNLERLLLPCRYLLFQSVKAGQTARLRTVSPYAPEEYLVDFAPRMSPG